MVTDKATIRRFEGLSREQRRELRAGAPKKYRKLHDRYVAAMGRKDFWFFMKYVLKNPVLYEPLHKPIADSLMSENWKTEKKMYLFPRGHVKSNIVTIGLALWEIVRNACIRILVASHKDEDAEKFLSTIKDYILSERFIRFYPEIRPEVEGGKRKKWSATKLLIHRNSTFTENTVEATSLKSKVTGRHYNLLICDDLVNEDNVQEPAQIKKTRNFHELVQSLLDPGAREVVAGTRYAFDDEYGRIQDTPEIAEEYEIYCAPAVDDLEVFHSILRGETKWTRKLDHKHLIYPSRYTLDRRDYISPDGDEMKNRKSLISLRKNQGSRNFANQMLLEPFDPSTAIFKEDDIKFVPALPKDTELTFFRVCDLSSELANNESYTAIVTGAMDARCNVYITDVFRKNCAPSVTIDELILGQQVDREIRPISVGMEPGPYERAIKPSLETRMRDDKVFVPLKFIPMADHQRKKEEHIMGLQPWIEAKKFFIIQGCRDASVLLDELIKFPGKTTRDVIDATAQIPIIMFPPNASRFLTDEEPKRHKVRGRTFMEEVEANTVDYLQIGNNRVMRGTGCAISLN